MVSACMYVSGNVASGIRGQSKYAPAEVRRVLCYPSQAATTFLPSFSYSIVEGFTFLLFGHLRYRPPIFVRTKLHYVRWAVLILIAVPRADGMFPSYASVFELDAGITNSQRLDCGVGRVGPFFLQTMVTARTSYHEFSHDRPLRSHSSFDRNHLSSTWPTGRTCCNCGVIYISSTCFHFSSSFRTYA